MKLKLKQTKTAELGLYSILALLLYLYFDLLFFGHLQFLEQYQLLLYTSDYIGELFSRPGGLSDLAGRFVTQFCCIRQTGALAMALLFVIAIHSSAKNIEYFTGKKLSIWALALPVTLLIFLYNEYAQVSFAVAIVLSLYLMLAIFQIRNELAYIIGAIIATLGGYWLIGPASILFVFGIIADILLKKKLNNKLIIIFGIVVIHYIAVIAAYRLLPYRLHTMLWGVDYVRYSAKIPVIMFVSLLMPIIAALVAHYGEIILRKIHGAGLWLATLIISSFIVVCISQTSGAQSEQFMRMDYWVRCGRWDKVINIAEKEGPRSQLALVYLNLSLGMEGQLINRFTQFPQIGTRGLINDWKRDCITAIPLAEVMYRLGNMNTALRYTMEAMEANTDNEKSGRALERMAEINLINGDYAVARKYCMILKDSWYYCDKAEKLLDMIAHPELIEQHPVYSYMRRVRYNEDFIFNKYKFHPELALKHLMQQNTENRLARDYYYLWMQILPGEQREYQDDQQVR